MIKIRCFPLIQIAKNNFEFYLGNISSIMAEIVRGFRKLFHHVIKRKTFSGNIFCYHSFEPYKRKIFSNLLPLEYHRRSLVEVRQDGLGLGNGPGDPARKFSFFRPGEKFSFEPGTRLGFEIQTGNGPGPRIPGSGLVFCDPEKLENKEILKKYKT